MKPSRLRSVRWISALTVLSLVLSLALPLAALADDIYNNLDASIDAEAEIMSLNVGGANGTTTLYVKPASDDSKPGCNLTGSTTLVVSVSSSDTSVATVSPSSLKFENCGAKLLITVTPLNAGSTTISLSETSNDTGSSFNLAPATFVVNVAPPANTAPTVTVAGVTAGASYEIGSVPAATCQVTDAEDGNSSFSATLSAVIGPLAAYGVGSQTASCSYTDSGGLTASSSVTYNIVDTTAPTIAFVSRTPAANSNGWNNSDVTVTWSCSDSGSGVVNATVFQTVNTEGANQEATGTCEDRAGNTASDTQTGINIDKTKPTISAAATTSPNGAGWYNADVVVHFTCSDDLSGIPAGNCPGDETLSTEGSGVSSISRTVTDAAGNTSDPSNVVTVNIDKSEPTLNPSVSPNPVVLNGSATASSGAEDGLSGIASEGCDPVDTSSIGTKTVNCTATDYAGNTATQSATYSVVYDWTGFFRPVDNNVLNVVKAGSAVPLKFSLAGYQGLDIFSSGYPTSGTVACDATGPVDDVAETVTAGGSSLSYDASVDQYVYVWKTEKSWAGTCRQLVVELNDGQSYFANFHLKK